MHDALTVSGLRKGYGSREVLKALDLTLAAGSWMCLIGANGAGKSTFFRTITGMLKPGSGAIAYSGVSLLDNPVEAKRHFGYAVDAEDLPMMLTGRQYLELVASARGVPEWGSDGESLMTHFSLGPHVGKRLGDCSHGTRKKVGILGACIGLPPVLLLDEPFNGLDPTSGFALKRLLRNVASQPGRSVLMSTHSVEMVATWCDSAALLRDGQLEPPLSMIDWREAGRTSHDFEMWVMDQLLEGDSTDTTSSPSAQVRPLTPS